jgi:antitoxin HigA-1
LIPPGEVLFEEFMKPLGITVTALAKEIDVPPGRISEIIRGRRSITADTALRLGKYFNVPPETWLSLQAEYEIRMVRRTSWPEIEPCIKAWVA